MENYLASANVLKTTFNDISDENRKMIFEFADVSPRQKFKKVSHELHDSFYRINDIFQYLFYRNLRILIGSIVKQKTGLNNTLLSGRVFYSMRLDRITDLAVANYKKRIDKQASFSKNPPQTYHFEHIYNLQKSWIFTNDHFKKKLFADLEQRIVYLISYNQ